MCPMVVRCCRLEVLGSCCQPKFLRSAPAAPGVVHVLLWHAVDSLPVVHLNCQCQTAATADQEEGIASTGCCYRWRGRKQRVHKSEHLGLHRHMPVSQQQHNWQEEVEVRPPFGQQVVGVPRYCDRYSCLVGYYAATLSCALWLVSLPGDISHPTHSTCRRQVAGHLCNRIRPAGLHLGVQPYLYRMEFYLVCGFCCFVGSAVTH